MPTPKTGALPLGQEFFAEFLIYFFLKIKKCGSKSVKIVPKNKPSTSTFAMLPSTDCKDKIKGMAQSLKSYNQIYKLNITIAFPQEKIFLLRLLTMYLVNDKMSS